MKTNGMETKGKKGFLASINLTKLNIALWGVIVIAAIIIGVKFCKSTNRTEVQISVDEKIDITPTIITSMKEIGEWEFLSVEDEELIDSVKKSFFRDDRLVRIYYGKLSLGINMHKAGPKWAEQRGDSIILQLPKVELLDNDFIDEARTRAFIEAGNWSDADRNDMYKRAYNLMLKRCMTRENIETAKTNAQAQLAKMMRTLGVEKFCIRWED